MSTGLDTSTVAPGRTAPDASLTIPAIALCARAMPGTTSTHTTVSARHLTSVRINLPSLGKDRREPGVGRGDNAYLVDYTQCKWDKASVAGIECRLHRGLAFPQASERA